MKGEPVPSGSAAGKEGVQTTPSAPRLVLKQIRLSVALLMSGAVCLAAQTTKKDEKVASPLFGWYGEFGGTGFSMFSIHGELTVFRFNRSTSGITWVHSLRASVGFFLERDYLPVAQKLTLLDSRHHIETGLGLTFHLRSKPEGGFFPTTSPTGLMPFGYRYEPLDGGGQIRVFVSHWYEFETRKLQFWCGLSLGVDMSFI